MLSPETFVEGFVDTETLGEGIKLVLRAFEAYANQIISLIITDCFLTNLLLVASTHVPKCPILWPDMNLRATASLRRILQAYTLELIQQTSRFRCQFHQTFFEQFFYKIHMCSNQSNLHNFTSKKLPKLPLRTCRDWLQLPISPTFNVQLFFTYILGLCFLGVENWLKRCSWFRNWLQVSICQCSLRLTSSFFAWKMLIFTDRPRYMQSFYLGFWVCAIENCSL